MHRYLVRAGIEPSPEVLSALSAASMTVQDTIGNGDPADVWVELGSLRRDRALNQVLDALSPPPGAQVVTVALNASSDEEAIATVRDALSRWGEIGTEVVGRRAAVALGK